MTLNATTPAGAIRAAFIAGESQRAEDLCQEFGMTLAEFGSKSVVLTRN